MVPKLSTHSLTRNDFTTGSYSQFLLSLFLQYFPKYLRSAEFFHSLLSKLFYTFVIGWCLLSQPAFYSGISWSSSLHFTAEPSGKHQREVKTCLILKLQGYGLFITVTDDIRMEEHTISCWSIIHNYFIRTR